MLVFICVLVLAVLSAPRGAESSSTTGGSVQNLFDLIKADNAASFEEMVNFHFHGQLPSLRNASGWTALHVAAYHGAKKVTEYLLNDEKRADLMAKNQLGETPLHFACQNDHAETATQLISAAKQRKLNVTAMLETEQVEGQTPIFYAAKTSINVVDVLLNKAIVQPTANLQHVDIYGLLPIHYAVAHQKIDVTTALLRKIDSDAAVSRPSCNAFGKMTISHLVAQHDFVQFGNDETLFNDYFNISAVDSLGQTPSCWAATRGSVGIAKQILQRDMNILTGNCVYDLKNRVNGSVLHVAAFNRQKHYVELLLRNGADVMALDSTGGTAVHALARQSASTANDAADIKEILKLFTSRALLARDNRGRTPFLLAAESSSLVFAKVLNDDELIAADLEAVDANGYSALHLVSSVELFRYLQSMSRRFQNIEVTTKSGNLTVLLSAVERRASETFLRHLLNLKPNKCAVNDKGRNAVHLAVEANYLEAIDIFAAFAFNFSARDNEGRTPLMYAIEIERNEAALRILENGLNKDDTCGDCRLDTLDTPLHIAAMKPSAIEVVKLLVKTGNINVSTVNANSETALHSAIAYANFEAVKVLMENGASSLMDVSDNLGRTPLHLAATWCNSRGVEIVKMILLAIEQDSSKSKLLESVDFNGLTPLEIAIRQNCFEIVDIMMSSSLFDTEACSRNAEEQTILPWHYAKALGHHLLAGMMLKKRKCPKKVRSLKVADPLLGRPLDCEDIHHRYRHLASGVFLIFPHERPPVLVYCDMTYLGGGWTVFQRRIDGSQDFFLKWADYKKGFGNLSANFWLGNDNIHVITSSGQYEYNLLVALTANDGSSGYGLYDGFRIDDEANLYTLRFRSFKKNGGSIVSLFVLVTSVFLKLETV